MENGSFESINTGHFPGDSIVVSTSVRCTLLHGDYFAVTRKAAAVENYGSREQENTIVSIIFSFGFERCSLC